jgi:hypothetical protein
MLGTDIGRWGKGRNFGGRRRGNFGFFGSWGPVVGCRGDLVVLLVFIKEIRDVQEGVALEADIHKGGLHAGQDTRDASLVDAAGQRILVGPLEVDFDQLVVFQDGHFGFVAGARNDQLFAHEATPVLDGEEGGSEGRG